jgi:hypothetical protein
VSQDPRDTGKTAWFETECPIGEAVPPSEEHLRPRLMCVLGEPRARYNLHTKGLTDEVRQGHESVPYVVLGRLIVTEHGIAYGREPMAIER